MDVQEQLVEALEAELRRQSDEGVLKAGSCREGRIRIDGEVDLEALAMVAMSAIAGSP